MIEACTKSTDVHHTVTYKGADNQVTVGRGEPVRVNLSIGVNSPSKQALKTEQTKIRKVLNHCRKPDLMMDLSIFTTNPEPWEVLRDEFGGPVGVLPHYVVFDEQAGINEAALLDRITNLVSKGIGFITIHASPTIDLFRFSTESRATPITSRGGSIVIRDMLRKNRQRSIYYELFDPIAKLAAQSGIVINLGTAFRSANVSDGMDMVTIHELRIQKELIERARSFGAKVVLEGPGHLLLSQVDEYVAQTDQLGVPRMPLGPIVTDAFPGLDHITSAVGASYMMSRSKGGIINSVTRVEHQGGIPNVGALIEALDAAQVAAHAATISYHQGSRQLDRRFSDSRSLIESCVLPRDGSAVLTRSKELAGCTRCGHLCPLTSDVYRA